MKSPTSALEPDPLSRINPALTLTSVYFPAFLFSKVLPMKSSTSALGCFSFRQRFPDMTNKPPRTPDVYSRTEAMAIQVGKKRSVGRFALVMCGIMILHIVVIRVLRKKESGIIRPLGLPNAMIIFLFFPNGYIRSKCIVAGQVSNVLETITNADSSLSTEKWGLNYNIVKIIPFGINVSCNDVFLPSP